MRFSSWCAGADPQDGHVLRADGQPPAQWGQADAVRQPAGALRRPVLLHLPQPAALPLQLSLHGSSTPGQPLFSGAEVAVATLSLPRSLFQMPHEVGASSQTSTGLSAQFNFTKHYCEVDEKKNEVVAVNCSSFCWSHAELLSITDQLSLFQ